MSGRFRRLSAPGAAALSCWRLTAGAAAWRRLFGVEPGAVPRVVRVGAPGAAFDEGLLLRVAEGAVELHLHGGAGVAAALRAWLCAEGWNEEPAAAPAALLPPLPDADEAWRRFLHAETPFAARAWQAFAGAGGAAGILAALERLPAAERRARAQSLHAAASWAELLETPPGIALVGPANAGKSSLFNAWLGMERATVADAPGTTRDAVGEAWILGGAATGLAVRLLDTAGLWGGAAGVDAEAARRSATILAGAWRRIWVFDAARGPEAETVAIFRAARRPADLLLLHRCDLGEAWSPEAVLGGAWLRGSVLREGSALARRLEARLLAALGPPPAPSLPPPFGAGLRAALREAAAG